jgi:thioredoxin
MFLPPMKITSPLKSLPLLALVALASLCSCDKARELVGHLAKQPAATTASSQAGPAESEIPKAIREMFPLGSSRIVIVDFYADWCGPCRQLSPILEKLGTENPSLVLVCKVNVDKFRELATQESVRSIPDVRIFRDGKLVDKFVGAPPEAEVRRRIEDLAQQLPALPQGTAESATPKPKEATIRTMTKDWMPPGINRR